MTITIDNTTGELSFDRLLASGAVTNCFHFRYGWAEYALILCGAVLGTALGGLLAQAVIALSDFTHGGF